MYRIYYFDKKNIKWYKSYSPMMGMHWSSYIADAMLFKDDEIKKEVDITRSHVCTERNEVCYEEVT